MDEVGADADPSWEDFPSWIEGCLAWPTAVAWLSRPACGPSRVIFCLHWICFNSSLIIINVRSLQLSLERVDFSD